MASKAAHKRLTKEYLHLQSSPPPYITARPSEENILQWHYIIDGPADTPYYLGQYYGTLTFPKEYPFKPPSIMMVTPNGRFQCSVKLCLSMSDYHPETWNPAWNVATILNGLLSVMNSNEVMTGGLKSTADQKKNYAAASLQWNTTQNKSFKQHFPDVWKDNELVLTGVKDRREMIRMNDITEKETAPTEVELKEQQALEEEILAGPESEEESYFSDGENVVCSSDEDEDNDDWKKSQQQSTNTNAVLLPVENRVLKKTKLGQTCSSPVVIEDEDSNSNEVIELLDDNDLDDLNDLDVILTNDEGKSHDCGVEEVEVIEL